MVYKLWVRRMVTCPVCSGNGCGACDGSGQVEQGSPVDTAYDDDDE